MNFIRIPLAKEDTEWAAATGQTEIVIRRSVPDPTPRLTRRTRRCTAIPSHTGGTLRRLRHWTFGGNNALGWRGRQTEGRRRRHGDASAARSESVAPNSQAGIDLTGFNNNYWVGLSVLHTLFVREHNYLCDELYKRYADQLKGQPAGTGRRVAVWQGPAHCRGADGEDSHDRVDAGNTRQPSNT